MDNAMRWAPVTKMATLTMNTAQFMHLHHTNRTLEVRIKKAIEHSGHHKVKLVEWHKVEKNILNRDAKEWPIVATGSARFCRTGADDGFRHLETYGPFARFPYQWYE